MDLIDRLRAIAVRAREHVDNLKTEEATKMALVVPFIEALGYNTWDPTEVVPEFIADVPMKKGEKVDYAILRDDRPIMLIECKQVGVNLDKLPMAQLHRYFHVTEARVGVVTDGLVYRFFSDLEAQNKMDIRPFLEFDIRTVDEAMANELKRFAKSSFDLDTLLLAAEEMKYTRAIKKLIDEQFRDPSDEVVRYYTKLVYTGSFTQAVRDKFHAIVHRAQREFINDRIENRLVAARDLEDAPTVASGVEGEGASPSEDTDATNGEIVTTQEELDGYYIVRAIVAEVLPPSRVVMRDTKTYCGVLVDDNNRRPLCRLWFNGKSKKYLGIFDENKSETKVPIDQVESIYQHAGALRSTAARYAKAQ
ncbi:MAG: type I restriction enzyme HsdR N-terminal domain-containing protein [Alphaproteobacteria bacterium]|nr:type I restriction enzyme HsdR N-terminal domain-containing protein [Alphaproteobacteria bacterium]